MPAKKLTDRQIAELYLNLVKHYQACVKDKMSPSAIYNALNDGIDFILNNPNNSLHDLDIKEHQKVYNILNTFFYATPQYRSVPQKFKVKEFFNPGNQKAKISII